MSRLPTVREFMDRHVQTISPKPTSWKRSTSCWRSASPGAGGGRQRKAGRNPDRVRLPAAYARRRARRSARGKVKDFMTSDVQTIPPTMDIYYCAGLFMNVSFRRFPVVENGRIVGAVTRFDLLRAVRHAFAQEPL